MAPRGSQRAHDGLQDGSYLKMAQNSIRQTSKIPQDDPKTVSNALRALSGPSQEPKMTRTPKEWKRVLRPSSLPMSS
eukprot:3124554-Pyramimonas_sp.AAC.1